MDPADGTPVPKIGAAESGITTGSEVGCPGDSVGNANGTSVGLVLGDNEGRT